MTAPVITPTDVLEGIVSAPHDWVILHRVMSGRSVVLTAVEDLHAVVIYARESGWTAARLARTIHTSHEAAKFMLEVSDVYTLNNLPGDRSEKWVDR